MTRRKWNQVLPMKSTKKQIFTRKTVALSFPLIAYCLAMALNSDLLCNILSPITGLTAAGILFYAYVRSDRSNKVSIAFLLCAFSCVAWGIADLLWLIMELKGLDPMVSPVLWIIYALTNFFILISITVFAVLQFSKWNLIQLFADVLSIVILSIFLFWIVFLGKDIRVLTELLKSDFTSVFSVITDILIISEIILWSLAVRSKKIPAFIRIISTGILLFALADIVYYYIEFKGLYIPNSVVDLSYAFSLYTIAFGSLYKTFWGTKYDLAVFTNVGRKRRWVFLLIYPLVMIVLKAVGIIEINLIALDYIAFAGFIAVYGIFSSYIQLSVEKETSLKHQNEILEQRVSEQIKELKFLADQDTLTTLYNRRYFVTCIDDYIETILPGETMALMLIDLDRFKTINDNFGHDVGDKVLIELSRRMMEWNNFGAILSRLGGDEFAILVIGKYTRREMEDYCDQVLKICSRPVCIGHESLEVTISLGVALLSPEACEKRTLFKNADIAMYGAKSQGYNKYLFYNPLVAENINKKNHIEALLRQAEVEKDFELFYQPQYSLPDMKLIGAEALIRWKNAEHGYIPPGVFIPVAEEIGYIIKLGKWVVQEAIRQAARWNEAGGYPMKIGFNISPKQLSDETFIEFLKSAIEQASVEVDWIDAEITESITSEDEKRVYTVVEAFRNLGISVSIDDFGSGYSSLGCLNKYHFDRIKIDKSLIDSVSLGNISGINVVKAAISMANAVGIKTIAEGVETREQLDILKELGCGQAQGYLLGRPVPAAVFERIFIAENVNGSLKEGTA